MYRRRGRLRHGEKQFAVSDGSHDHHGAGFVGAARRGRLWCLWGPFICGAGVVAAGFVGWLPLMHPSGRRILERKEI